MFETDRIGECGLYGYFICPEIIVEMFTKKFHILGTF
jgi:hypothetical protein